MREVNAQPNDFQLVLEAPPDNRPEYVKFLVDILEWRKEKVDLLANFNEL